eukprot:m.224041 g.224041  ORF g.224041 m.224041 type:complete len:240 (+) comp34011_c0_seq1:67-786(+)
MSTRRHPPPRADSAADKEDPEDLKDRNEGGVESYYRVLETSQFEDAVVDTGMAIAVINLTLFLAFQFGTSDALLPLSTAFAFLPMHMVNHVFHFRRSVKKRAYRIYFFLTMGLVGTIQSLFYLTRMGIDSGFLMSLLVALIYPANAVAYVEEETLMSVGAIGLFAGGAVSIYMFLNLGVDPIAPITPAMKLLLQSLNFVVAFAAALTTTYAHLERHERAIRLEEALAFSARETSASKRR